MGYPQVPLIVVVCLYNDIDSMVNLVKSQMSDIHFVYYYQ